MARYEQFLSISYAHEFYAKTGRLQLSCEANSATARLFNNMGVLLKASANSVSFLFDKEQFDNAQEMFQLFADEEITCYLYPMDNPAFYGYTAGFQAKDPGAFLFTLSKDDSEEGLSQGGYASFASNKFAASEVAELKFRKKKQIPIVFKTNTSELEAFSESMQLELSFKTIQSYFKYYICGFPNAEALKIVDVDNNIEFSESVVEIEEGKQSQVFVSTSPIMLRYQSKQHLRLVENGSGSQRVLMDYMPIPKPGSYFSDQVNGEPVMVSEVFIN